VAGSDWFPKYAPAGFHQSLWMQARVQLARRPLGQRKDEMVGGSIKHKGDQQEVPSFPKLCSSWFLPAMLDAGKG